MAATGLILTSADDLTRPLTPGLSVKLTNELDPETARQVLLFAYSACRLDADALGWMPKRAYDERHRTGNLLALWNNDDLVAFTMFYFRNVDAKIYQIWVRRDARQILHGRALIDDLEQRAKKAGCLRIRLWCAEDLPANLFWQALHFQYVTWRHGRRTAKRRHILWVRPFLHSLRAPPNIAAPPTDVLDPSKLRPFLPHHVAADRKAPRSRPPDVPQSQEPG